MGDRVLALLAAGVTVAALAALLALAGLQMSPAPPRSTLVVVRRLAAALLLASVALIAARFRQGIG